MRDAIGEKLVTLSGAFALELRSASTLGESEPLMAANNSSNRFKSFLASFFAKYDRNGDGSIDKDELALLLRDVNENMDKSQVTSLMAEIDTDHSGGIGKLLEERGGK